MKKKKMFVSFGRKMIVLKPNMNTEINKKSYGKDEKAQNEGFFLSLVELISKHNLEFVCCCMANFFNQMKQIEQK